MIILILLGVVVVCLTDDSFFPDANVQDNEDIDLTDTDFSKFERISERKCEEYVIKYIYLRRDPRRIYKGKKARSGEFPYMGALGWRSKDPNVEWKYKCGSTLISEWFLLTAGHCSSVPPSTPDVVNIVPEVVMLGAEDINDKRKKVRQPKIVKITVIKHPEYHSPKKYNDIALLKAKERIQFTQFIMPACIWTHEEINLVGKFAFISGWGKTEEGKQPSHLRYGKVDITENDSCNQIKSRHWSGMMESQMCAGLTTGEVDTCQGDSGGPLVYRELPEGHVSKKYPSIVGITSFGKGCGIIGIPTVYTRVSYYADWIEENVWKNDS